MQSSQFSSKVLEPQNWEIECLPGLEPSIQTQLKALGIRTTLQLCRQTRTERRIQELATRLQVHVRYVNKWAALADLSRVPSVGCQYCGLILHAGVGSCRQLAKTPPHRLHAQVRRLQVATLQRSDLCPGVDQAVQWVEQARQFIG